MIEEITNGIKWGLMSGTGFAACTALWALLHHEGGAAAQVGAMAFTMLLPIAALMSAES